MGLITINTTNLTKSDEKLLMEIVEKSNQNGIFNPKENEEYFYIGKTGGVEYGIWNNSALDAAVEKTCNLSTSVEYMDRIALKQTLFRKLEKFSWLHGGNNINYADLNGKWVIGYDIASESFNVFRDNVLLDILTPHFVSHETAEQAIEEVIKPFLKDYELKVSDIF